MIEGLLIGLSVGASCLASCGPLVISVIMKNTPTTFGAYAYLGKFLSGRLLAYIIIAFMVSMAHGTEWQTRNFVSATNLIAGLMMIANAFIKLPSYCVKGRSFKSLVRQYAPQVYVPTLGFFSAINACPPIIAAASSAAVAESAVEAILTFIMFFIGSSVYMLPLPLISAARDKEALHSIGKFASVIVGIVMVAKGLLGFDY